MLPAVEGIHLIQIRLLSMPLGPASHVMLLHIRPRQVLNIKPGDTLKDFCKQLHACQVKDVAQPGCCFAITYDPIPLTCLHFFSPQQSGKARY